MVHYCCGNTHNVTGRVQVISKKYLHNLVKHDLCGSIHLGSFGFFSSKFIPLKLLAVKLCGADIRYMYVDHHDKIQ